MKIMHHDYGWSFLSKLENKGIKHACACAYPKTTNMHITL